MEKFNVVYRTSSGDSVTAIEEFENMDIAVETKSQIFNFESFKPGTYYAFNTGDNQRMLINPKCLESIKIDKIVE